MHSGRDVRAVWAPTVKKALGTQTGCLDFYSKPERPIAYRKVGFTFKSEKSS